VHPPGRSNPGRLGAPREEAPDRPGCASYFLAIDRREEPT